MRVLFGVLLASLFATGASAGDLSLSLRTPKGQAIRDAVVTVTPASGGGGATRFDWPYRMAQHNMQFDPFVLIVPVGASVVFPNQDNVRHQVYSFSPTRPFELKLYGKDEARTVRFDKAGVVAVGCNIHDSMVGFIKVVDTPFAAKSDGAGQVLVRGPSGSATVRIWHPYLKGPGNEVVRTLALPRDGVVREALVLDVRPPAPRHNAY